MIALPEKAIEPDIASARPGQSGGRRRRRRRALPTCGAPGSAAMAGVRIACDSRDDAPCPSAPARLRRAHSTASTAHRRRPVLPLALLLFAQWPLRDLVGAWSREANDVAQWIFALYVAFAVRARHGRGRTAADARPGEPGWRRRIERCGEAVCVLPWALFVLVAGAAPTWRSLIGLEAFPDTFDPLYFVIRSSAWLLALGVALQPRARPPPAPQTDRPHRRD